MFALGLAFVFCNAIAYKLHFFLILRLLPLIDILLSSASGNAYMGTTGVNADGTIECLDGTTVRFLFFCIPYTQGVPNDIHQYQYGCIFTITMDGNKLRIIMIIKFDMKLKLLKLNYLKLKIHQDILEFVI